MLDPLVVCPNVVTEYNGVVLTVCVGNVLFTVVVELGGDVVIGVCATTFGVGVNTY